jgi:methylenetetrahydrofolate dehydrogenase (NAD+)
LEEVLPISDLVIAGVPTKQYKIPTALLKEGVIAINFSTFPNFADDIQSKASLFVPSVGKVTVAMLERNLLRLYEYQRN